MKTLVATLLIGIALAGCAQGSRGTQNTPPPSEERQGPDPKAGTY